MPLYQNRTFMERIYTGGVEIKRVYRGKDLVWGIYELIYHDRTEDTSGYQPGRYVWGIRYDLMSDLDDYFEEYKTHYDGWYEDSAFIVAIPYVTKDLHKDLDLYAKWRQRKFSYNGVVRYWTVKVSPSDIRDEPPTPSDSSYPWGGSGSYAMPNCTWYAYYRAQEAGAPNPTPGFKDAGRWWLNNAINGWVVGSGNWGPGDILVWNGHVAFVEGDGEISESVWTESVYSPSSHTLNRSDTASDLYDDVITYWDYDARSMSGGYGGKLSTRYWSKGSSSNWASMSSMIGFLHYTGEWGGGSIEEWDDEPWPVSETECSDQNDPELPNANDIKRGDISPSGEYRDSFWDVINKNTDERTFDYIIKDWGNWNRISTTDWLTTWN